MKIIKWLISFLSRTTNIIAVAALLLCLSAAYLHPEKVWMLPLFGMLMPFFVFVNFLFVIIWIWRRRYFALVSVFAIMLCVPQLLHLFSFGIFKNHEAADKPKIKILSYNVRDFDLYNWSENRNSKNEIFKTIKDIDADIICFQEFYSDTSQAFNTVKQLQDAGYSHYYFTRELVLRNTDEWGIAIFSKKQIVDSGQVLKQNFKTGYGKQPYKGIYADVAFSDTTIRIFCVHLQSIYFGKDEYQTIVELKENQNIDENGVMKIVGKLRRAFVRRAKQATELKSILDKQSLPYIVCGDFNDLPNSYVYNTVSKNLKDAFLENGFGVGSTYSGNIPFLRIDYMLSQPMLQPVAFRIDKNKISDHHPVWAEYVFEK